MVVKKKSVKKSVVTKKAVKKVSKPKRAVKKSAKPKVQASVKTKVEVTPTIVVPKKPKTLVVYYSLEGNTKALGDEIARELEADVLELKPLKDISPKGLLKYVWGGRQAMMKHLPELPALIKNPQDYELIIVGTPVWAWTFSPAVRSFLKKTELKGKKVAYFATHEGGLGKTLEHLEHELKENTILHKADFAYVKKTLDESKKRAVDWAKEVKSKLEFT